VDGILGIPDAGCRVERIIDGDAEYVPIAAASILAKTGRDTWVLEWCADNQEAAAQYDLASNKGYGAPKHRAGLQTYGAIEGHRAQFVRKWLPEA
jgi:ribonuclease HII